MYKTVENCTKLPKLYKTVQKYEKLYKTVQNITNCTNSVPHVRVSLEAESEDGDTDEEDGDNTNALMQMINDLVRVQVFSQYLFDRSLNIECEYRSIEIKVKQ